MKIRKTIFFISLILIGLCSCNISKDKLPIEKADIYSQYKNIEIDRSMINIKNYNKKEKDTCCSFLFSHPINANISETKYNMFKNVLEPVNNNEYAFTFKGNAFDVLFPIKPVDDILLKLPDETMLKVNIPASNKLTAKKCKKNDLHSYSTEMVSYGISSFFSTPLGLKFINQINSFQDLNTQTLDFVTDKSLSFEMNNKYIIFFNEKQEMVFIVYAPFCNVGGNIHTFDIKEVNNCESRYSIKFEDTSGLVFDNTPIEIEYTINTYQKKEADSTIRKSQPNTNQYLDNISYVSGTLGDEAITLARFDSTKLFRKIGSKNIQKVEYIIYPYFVEQPEKIILIPCDKPWSSTKITWNTRQEYEGKPIYPSLQDKELRFDITEMAKEWAVNSDYQYNGFILKSEEGGMVVFPSGDNGYLSPRIKIIYKQVE